MKFFQDVTDVTFVGIDHIFRVSSVFCEFAIGSHVITIRWYGVIIALGFALAALLGGRIAYTWKMDLGKMIDVLIYGTLGGVIGARLYYVAFKWSWYSAHPADIFKIWEGGLAIYGGIIGGVLAAFITAKIEKLNFLNLLDCVGISLLVGQGIGRWGNFANQEAFGVNTNGSYGMMSRKVSDYILANQASLPGVDPTKPVHPTFFYEFVWCMLGVLVLWLVTRKWRKFSGQTALCYGVWYGTGRAVIEGLRTDSLYIGDSGIRVSQLVSIIAVVICAATLVVMLVLRSKHPKPVEGIDFFTEPKPFFKFQKKKAAAEAGKNDTNAAETGKTPEEKENDVQTD